MRVLAARLLCVVASVTLGGCQQFWAAAGTFTGVNVIALTTVGRSAPDAIYSLIRDRDCSVVRLEQNLSYCVPPEAPPPPAEFCTHSLAMADCWTQPALLPGQPRGLADTPSMTPAQIASGAHHWPDL